MPENEIKRRGGAIAWRTVTVGKGKKRRYMRVAIVTKAGPQGGHTIAGPLRAPQAAAPAPKAAPKRKRRRRRIVIRRRSKGG